MSLNQRVVRIGQNENIGTGERLFKLTATNNHTRWLLGHLANSFGLWDRVVIPLLNRSLSRNGFVVELQKTNFVMSGGKRVFRTRKWFEKGTLYFWATFTTNWWVATWSGWRLEPLGAKVIMALGRNTSKRHSSKSTISG